LKVLIVAISITILFTGFLIYQQDNNRYIRELENLKHAADECSASASLLYHPTEFSQGRKIFNQTEGIEAIKYMLKSYLNLDDILMPLDNTYWQDQITYDAYFLDTSNTTFPYLFTDPLTGYVKTITEPTVIVTINAGTPHFRLSFLSPDDAIRSSSYEYDGR